MPYATERGVRSYSDHDTPPEFATSADEDRAAYNAARDEAFATAETVCSLLDEAWEPPACSAAAMQAIADGLASILAAISKGAAP